MRGTTVPPGTPCLTPRTGEPPLHRLEVAGPGAVPFAAGDFDSLGPYARWDRPHRHTFYEIVHVTAGTGTHVVDLTRRPLAPQHLAVIAPGQVHHWEDGHALDGTLVLFTEDFLVDHPGDRELLRRLAERGWYRPPPGEGERIGALMTELVGEYEQRGPGWEGVLRALLHVLAVRVARLPDAPAPGVPAEGRGAAVAQAFVRLIARPEAVTWTVRECAERLGVTPGHLTHAVRSATGRSPGRLLIEARTCRAQRLLAHTDLSVRQVAARTGFTDPAYFSRFFRRETGQSPVGFRKHHSRAHQSLEAPPAPA
ncbi:AraC family transcriptional regulator [Streptomyces pharetrae CZA14]|uniref:AraC family transcriptional regulator n=1 Tax=Streptomyces pharetrae CZA14 TaxID=1144883 RepID=A0ABX3YPN9_9ACTN|nr:AraC family transcriptional regulator [Streptomyces pharetrae CZA14]